MNLYINKVENTQKNMPHFIIDCSENILKLKTPQDIIQKVYNTAELTNLFDKGDIKVRINPFEFYTIGNTKNDFINIFANIMEGRTISQKKEPIRKNY